MIGFIITGHGNFATGVLSGIKVIAGDQPEIAAIDFEESDSSEALEGKIKSSIEAMSSKEIICFCDLAGGTPYKTCAMLSSQYSIKVISGANVPMVLGCLFEREELLDVLSGKAAEAGKGAIDIYAAKEFKQETSEDGI